MRRPNLLRQPATPSGYMDALGQIWDTAVLDRLLGDTTVWRTVRSLYISALCDQGGVLDFSPGVVWSWLKSEYRREEVAALYLLLVARYRDTCATPPVGEGQGAQP